MFLTPPNNILAENSSPIFILNILQQASQIAMIGLLIVLKPRDSQLSGKIKWATGLALLCLFIYYALWICYFIGYIHPLMLVGMAVFPVAYFFFVAIWLKNYPAIIPTILFGILHIGITSVNYL